MTANRRSGAAGGRTGRYHEHRAVRHLRAAGYAVLRSAGSRTAVDLAAFKPGQVLFCQVKRNGRITTAEWNELVRLAARVNGRESFAVPLLIDFPSRTVRCRRLLRPLRDRERRDPALAPFRLDIDLDPDDVNGERA